jgi:DNA-3-methyladenine glycosylase II
MNSYQLTPHVLEGHQGVAAGFSLEPSGPFDLARQSRHFGGWPVLGGEPGAIVMAFPVEGSEQAAAVVLRQPQDRLITAEVHGCPAPLAEQAARQALAAVSLDVDGSGWPQVGRRDGVIGGLQRNYGHLRPTLFHSPYEAAASFVIGHRISIKQARATRAKLAAELGTLVAVEGQSFHPFPAPAQLLAAPSLPGVSQVKGERLRAIALAAQDGWLARQPLRELPQDDALARSTR